MSSALQQFSIQTTPIWTPPTLFLLQLTSQLTNLREKYKVLYADKSELENTLTTFQDRCKQSQDEILALRGRLTSTRRSHEHLEMKCSTLEDIVQKLNSRSPTVVKVTTRSREEVRLSEECKRKASWNSICCL